MRPRGLILLVAALAAVGLWVSGGTAGAGSGATNGMIGYVVFHDKGSCAELIDCFDLRLWVVDPRSGASSPLQVDCPRRDCDDGGLAWSPSGQEVALYRHRLSSGLYVARADGSEARLVTNGDHPTWSADGSAFAVEGKTDLFIVNADGSSRRRLTYRGGASPDWSSTDRIVFERGSPFRRRGLYAVNPDGTGLRRLTWSGDQLPEWSPDGRWLAFQRDYPRGEGSFVWEIAMLRASGGRVRRLTHGGGEHPAWSPDGERIAFVRGRRLMVLTLGTDKVRTLVTLRGRRSFDGVDWQPRP
jgi:Tol biopolymer transport system component